jgi:beta-lactamase class A
MTIMNEAALQGRIEEIRESGGFHAIGVHVYDDETGREFSHAGDRWFHAASTMKAAVLLTLFKKADAGALRLDDRLHVRNRFRSIADRSIFNISRDRDADAAVHRRIGRSMKLIELAHPMITRSSNLATNLLLDYLTPAAVQETIAAEGVDGVKVVRGVEDGPAFEQGINNVTTARGLVQLFRLLRDPTFLPDAARRQMLEIFLAQEFKSMIPALLPPSSEVAHKTGEISTCTHDSGLVLLPGRHPYAVAILTEHDAHVEAPQKAVAKVSRAVYEFIMA